MKRLRLCIHQLFHWEYWPMKVVYFPLLPFWLFLTLKSRSFFFFNAANPLIKNGGMAMESKNDIYEMMPEKHIPKTLFFTKETAVHTILDRCRSKSIKLPFIIKPDIGMKGLGVSKITNQKALKAYIKRATTDYIVQEYIDYPNEVGIFYVRLPHETKGKITGIVGKEFLKVVGDGKKTLQTLIEDIPRGCLQWKRLEKAHGDAMGRVLPKNEVLTLVPIGSHTLGARFIDLSHKNNAALTTRLNEICMALPEFYYGRLDIKLTHLEDLAKGKNYSVIEVNGAGSEPTHIYDPNHSIFYAWKEICRHWVLLQKISQTNCNKGISYLSFKEGIAMLRNNEQLEKQLREVF